MGEFNQLSTDIHVGRFGGSLDANVAILALMVNGGMAFGLNYVSLTANGKTSALMMCVAGMVTCFSRVRV